MEVGPKQRRLIMTLAAEKELQHIGDLREAASRRRFLGLGAALAAGELLSESSLLAAEGSRDTSMCWKAR